MLDEETDAFSEKVLVKTEVYFENKLQGDSEDTICLFHLPRGQVATFTTTFQ